MKILCTSIKNLSITEQLYAIFYFVDNNNKNELFCLKDVKDILKFSLKELKKITKIIMELAEDETQQLSNKEQKIFEKFEKENNITIYLEEEKKW